MKREPKAAKHARETLSIGSAVSTVTFEDVQSSPKGQGFPEKYKPFEKLNGHHPWQDQVPEGYVLYAAQKVENAKIAYFNFELAKEMGLISENHPEAMNKQLEAVLLDTFALRIVNEYDLQKQKKIRTEKLKPNRFMATRYLQLQHSNKQGATSGDGRSIWNGVQTFKGKTWDVSSRGTGVTCLSPGYVEAGKPLPTGGNAFGYGCGLADLDELIGSAIMSEVFHRQGIPTERVLVVLDIGKKLGIGVRAHTNLLRPAHIFLFLKQGRYKSLRLATDYFIDRQVQNKAWTMTSKGLARYDEMARLVAKSFAYLAARFDTDYIFVWMDWDGDNILADGSIIDYGSVRQFGLRHDQYRYDDVDRFSSNLNEQRIKAKQIVQTFAQIADYLKTGRKKPVRDFAHHKALAEFDFHFEEAKRKFFLARMGFSPRDREKVLKRYSQEFNAFLEVFTYFERTKTSKGLQKVADGVNHPAIFNMRSLMRELPQLLIENQNCPVPSEVLFELMLSSQASKQDSKMTEKQDSYLQELQCLYIALMDCVRGRRSTKRYLSEILSRSRIINKADRMTGNGITSVVEEMMEKLSKGLPLSELQHFVTGFIHTQVLVPESYLSAKELVKRRPPRSRAFMKKLLKVVGEYHEDI